MLKLLDKVIINLLLIFPLSSLIFVTEINCSTASQASASLHLIKKFKKLFKDILSSLSLIDSITEDLISSYSVDSFIAGSHSHIVRRILSLSVISSSYNAFLNNLKAEIESPRRT